MALIKKIKYMIKAGLKAGHIYDILQSPYYIIDRILGELIRTTHSIEKGLSLDAPRLGFGYARIMEGFKLIEMLKMNGGDINSEQVIMFADALSAYLNFHNKKNYINSDIQEIKVKYKELAAMMMPYETTFGGILHIKKQEYSESELKAFNRLFYERHSIRAFNGTPVDTIRLQDAINMAMRCPSACNRQCYRVHILEKKDFAKMKSMDGIGGFFQDLDKFLLITAKLSVYRTEEEMQYIVTSSVFAGYLTLSLQANNIGCCFIQRQCVPTEDWEQLRVKLNISGDEQLVCGLGIGNYKEEYFVPYSHRLCYDSIVSYC